jgi:hypothetical protein
MADEVLINRLYDIVDEITRIGGEQERTSITPGVLVAVASPSDLPTGYIKIVNPRDSTYVPCLTVNGLVVSDNDLVNVLFTRGTEPIALSQSANSPSNTLKVSEIWESDFGAVAMESDATGNITINSTGTLTIPTDLIHAGDPDTKVSLTDDIISFDAGGINLLKLTETAQDLVEIGDVAGGGDVDINFNDGAMFIRGSDSNVALGKLTPASILDIRRDQNSATRLAIRNATAGTAAQAQMQITNDINSSFQCGITSSTFTTAGELTADDAFFQSLGGIDLVIRAVGAGNIKIGTNANTRMYISSGGLIGINGVTSPSTELDMGAGAIEFDEMTAPGGGAVNTARLYAVDNGAGKTQLAVVFNTGAVQVLATEP